MSIFGSLIWAPTHVFLELHSAGVSMLLFVRILAVITFCDSTHDVMYLFVILRLAHNCVHDCSQHGLLRSLLALSP